MIRTARILLFGAALSACCLGASPNVVISQVYGGGGNSGATYRNDFIELHNRGTATVNLNGWSVQYGSSGGSTWTNITNLSGSIAPGQYYLVQEAAGAAGTVSLPAPDVTGSINMSGTAGKVALVNGTAALTCGTACATAANVVDFIGYGAANNYEGSGPAPGLSNTTASLRAANGCTDTDNNATDFAAGAPNPRNTAASLVSCVATISALGSSSSSSVAKGSTVLLTVAVTPAGNPASTGIGVTMDLSLIGGSNPQTLYDDGTHGDVTAGDNVFSYLATVDSAATVGQKSLAFTASDAQARTAGGSINLTVTAVPLVTSIHTVQGPGTTSPLVNEYVTVRGIVTGLKSNGFYLQSKPADYDADENTSEGVLVFTGSGNLPAGIAVGDEMDVTGTVSEFVTTAAPGSTGYSAPPGSATLTELVAPLSYATYSTGNPLPPAVPIDSSKLSATYGTAATRWSQMEKYEGMRVTFTGLTVLQGVGSTSVFAALSGTATPLRETGLLADMVPAGTAATVPVWDGNPETFEILGGGLTGTAASLALPTGSTIGSLTGIVDYSTSGGFYIVNTNALGVSGTVPAAQPVAPVQAPAPTDLTIATMNVQNFSSSDTGRLTKIQLAIRDVLRMPDVLAFQEVDTQASLEALAALLNADASQPAYQAALLTASTSQNVGFLYKPSRFSAGPPMQHNVSETFPNPLTGAPEIVFDRPPLTISGTAKLPGSDSGIPLTVVANHLKAITNIDNVNNNAGSDAGIRIQAKRHFGGRSLGLLLQSLSAGTNLVSVGDHNAYQFNDGYVDVMGCVKGALVDTTAQIYQPPAGQACGYAGTGNVLTNLTDLSPTNRISYVFNGSRQTFDHIVVNNTAMPRVRSYASVPVNTNYKGVASIANDTTRPEGYADHDPQVMYLTLPNEVTSKVKVSGSGMIYNRALAAWTGTITVKNTGSLPLSGPLYVFFKGLPAGLTMTNASGFSGGIPYLTIPLSTPLAAGASTAAAAVRFAGPLTIPVTYTTATYSVAY